MLNKHYRATKEDRAPGINLKNKIWKSGFKYSLRKMKAASQRDGWKEESVANRME